MSYIGLERQIVWMQFAIVSNCFWMVSHLDWKQFFSGQKSIIYLFPRQITEVPFISQKRVISYKATEVLCRDKQFKKQKDTLYNISAPRDQNSVILSKCTAITDKYSFYGTHFCWCLARCAGLSKRREQCLHTKPSCFPLEWICKLWDIAYTWSHWSHGNSVCFPWSFTCVSRDYLVR